MFRYIIRRILEAIPSLIGVSAISFLLLHIVPGNPVRILLGNRYTPERAAILAKHLGLSLPLWQQYFVWLGNFLRGDFGYSYVYNEPVSQLILQALPHTILLGWLPSGGVVNPIDENPSLWSYVRHLILPAATLILTSLAAWARYMRSSTREAMLQDYIRTARAKGLSEFRVVFWHALRNSVLPLVTLLGISIPGLFAGALFVEEIFNYPGMGLLYWTAVNDRDFPVILGIIMFLGVLTILGNLLADILYGIIDPRIQYK